jgi:protein SCO1/2
VVRHTLPWFALLALLAAGCSKPPANARQFTLTGQVLDVRSGGAELVVRHDDIPGFMPGMTMPFKVKPAAGSKGCATGDLIRATLHVTDTDAWLSDIVRTGSAPLPARTEPLRAPAALVEPGDEVPDQELVDQDGSRFRLSSLRPAVVLLTFIYTRCPLPEYCPRMDARFAEVQRSVEAGRVPGPVRLVSVSFDPDFDTPAELSRHAGRAGANPAVWRFATGPKAAVEAWGARLGLSLIRDEHAPAGITHNLRTAVIDRRGRLVRILDGNQWTADQAVAALASAASAPK